VTAVVPEVPAQGAFWQVAGQQQHSLLGGCLGLW